MSKSSLLAVRRGAVGVLTINRPETRNALTPDAAAELSRAIASFDDDPEIKAIVLTGAGNAFCAGGDLDFLAQLRQMSQEEIKTQVYRSFQGVTRALRLCTKPVIAAVDGPAYGAGCEIAIACDFRIVSHDAVFCENWIDLGLMPPLGGLFLLPRLVGLERANDMVMRASKITGKRAAEIGLASEAVEPAALFDTAIKLANELASKSGSALSAIKQGLRRGLESQIAAEWEYCVNAQAILIGGADFTVKVDRLLAQVRGRPA